jgi:hypothetical protein
VIKNVRGSILKCVVPATRKGNVITNLPKNSKSVDTRANNNQFTTEDITSAKQDSDKKLVVVSQPPTEDTSIETPNEISGEVALKTSDPAEWEVTPDLIHHFAKHIPSQSIESDFFLKGKVMEIRYNTRGKNILSED